MLRPQPFNLLGTEIRNRDWPLENGPCPRCDQHILGMKISTRPHTTQVSTRHCRTLPEGGSGGQG